MTADFSQDIAVDATRVYWTEVGSWPDYTDGSVLGVDKSGGAPVTLASGQNSPRGIAVDAASVYWTCDSALYGSSVVKLPLGGGMPLALAGSPHDPWRGIAVDATSVYFTTFDLTTKTGKVMKLTPK